MIKVEHLYKQFGGVHAVEDATLSIETRMVLRRIEG